MYLAMKEINSFGDKTHFNKETLIKTTLEKKTFVVGYFIPENITNIE